MLVMTSGGGGGGGGVTLGNTSPWTAAQVFTSGTVSLPGVATGEASTGWYLPATGHPSLSALGVKVLDYGDTTASVLTLTIGGAARFKFAANASYLGTSVLQFGQSPAVPFVQFDPQSDGVFDLLAGGGGTTPRINFGGHTSSFPALKRSSATLAVRLADDSVDAALTASSVTASTFLKSTATTVAGLTAAATAGAGARSFVTDATATTFLSTVAGGGANKVPVVSDGTNWLIG